jgi:hypothetical protein
MPHIHWEGVTLGVRHLLSENTIVHTSIIRNCEDSWEKKKIFVPLSESFVPASEFFRNRVVFFRNRVVFFPDVGTPYTILPPSSEKKTSRCFRTSHQTMGDDISTPKHNTGLGVHAT